jgi:hypothetical protein
MSSTWLDVPEAESFDGYGGDEAAEDYLAEMYGDGEAFAESDDEAESRYSRRRRRARRLARARRRRRAALARARYARMPVARPPTAAVVQKTEADVANLEVESTVQADTLGSAVAAQRDQGRAAINAAAAGAVVPSLLSFLKTAAPDEADKLYFKAGSSFLPLFPLALLRSPGRGLTDPRLWAVAGVAGLTIAEDRASKGRVVERVEIDRSVTELKKGLSAQFRAVPLDRNRRRASLPPGATIEWESSDSLVTVDPKVGESVKVTAGSSATTNLVATITAILKGADGSKIDDDFVNVTVK